MKKILASIASLAMLLLFVSPVLAVKPTPNLAAAEKVDWNLSGAVMPVPPYGLHDITGSDTASKLIVNQPNGNTEVAITGVMNGLAPNTTYTVYPSNAWATSQAWNVTGTWNIDIIYGATTWHEVLVLAQTGSQITGTSIALVGGGSPWTVSRGSVVGTDVEFDIFYNAVPAMTARYSAHINPLSGSIVNGNWADVAGGLHRSGTWASTSGVATQQLIGGYPGLFGNLQTFTFVTDEFGSGSWHLNLRDENFDGPNTYRLSIWINGAGATILVSDNFDVVVN